MYPTFVTFAIAKPLAELPCLISGMIKDKPSSELPNLHDRSATGMNPHPTSSHQLLFCSVETLVEEILELMLL